MKGILGRKIGMTQLYLEHGKLIPVTVVEVQPNVVTNVFTKEKNGYVAIQLGVENKKKSRQNKPELGHAKKANTTPKYFVREIRNMDGYKLGSVINASIFKIGELVDVQSKSKGHGFSGNIKRHNQSIGPKSHGGGGGSKPIRQTGSIGDVAGGVVKGMTMPGQYGNVIKTVQNLEVVSVDVKNNIILIKGSIPGPKKSFVIIKESVKGLPSQKVEKLVNLKEIMQKNHLLEKAKKSGVSINTDMSILEMETILEKNLKEKEALDKEKSEAEAKLKNAVKTETLTKEKNVKKEVQHKKETKVKAEQDK